MAGDFFLNESGFFNRGSRIIQRPYVTRRFAIPNALDKKERYKASLRHKFRMAQSLCQAFPDATSASRELSTVVDDLMDDAEVQATTAAEAEETIKRELERISPVLPARVNQLAKAMSDRGIAATPREAVKLAIVQGSQEVFSRRATSNVIDTPGANVTGLRGYTGDGGGATIKSGLATLALVGAVAWLVLK